MGYKEICVMISSAFAVEMFSVVAIPIYEVLGKVEQRGRLW